jgi:acyl carrier protein
MTVDDRTPLDTGEIESRLMTFMRTELLSPDATLDRGDDLLSGSVLDSIGVLRLAAFLRAAFHVDMQPADFVTENFRTVAVLTEYVRRSTERAGRPPADSVP